MSESPPVLLHVGYHKTATTWLQRFLFDNRAAGFRWLDKAERAHPVRELVRARPFTFDAEACAAGFEPLLREARADNLLPVVSFERFSGHPFSGGHDAELIANRLAAVFPEARVLIVIREQRNMIVSTYKQYVSKGGPCSPRDFLLPATSKSMRVPWFDFSYFEYDHLIERYRSLFGPEAVLTVVYEQFVRSPDEIVSTIAEFAGRPLADELVSSLPYGHRTNPAHPATAIAVWRRVNRLFARSELNQAPLVESAVLQRALRRLIKRASRRWGVFPASDRREAALRREIAGIVGDRYVPSNRATAELIGVDLGAYGWMV